MLTGFAPDRGEGMGKPTGFLEVERVERGYEKPAARKKSWKEFVHPLAEADAARPGLALHGLRHPVLPRAAARSTT